LQGEPDCRERGYLDLLGARMALLANEVEQALECGERARDAGDRFGDPDLESLGLVHVGEANLYLGRIREGLAAIDEAGVSVAASGLSPWAGGLVYCGVIFTCMTRADWQRAGQWTQQFTRWSEGKGVAGYPGLCRMHRAEVLAVRGELREAEREIRATQEMLARQAPWAEGDAWRVLGDVLLAKGALQEAREAYSRATELGWESQFGLALVRFAQGDAPAATRLLARALAENAWSCRSKRGQALAHYAIIATAAGEPGAARAALAELGREPDLTSTPALEALVARGHAELAAAEGRTGEAITLLRSALRTWQTMNAPVEGAMVRCRLAVLLEVEGDPESAALELAAAKKVFQETGAGGLMQQCERQGGEVKREQPVRRGAALRAKQ
jgi:tetratricopeptide (TPR) repeat protein